MRNTQRMRVECMNCASLSHRIKVRSKELSSIVKLISENVGCEIQGDQLDRDILQEDVVEVIGKCEALVVGIEEVHIEIDRIFWHASTSKEVGHLLCRDVPIELVPELVKSDVCDVGRDIKGDQRNRVISEKDAVELVDTGVALVNGIEEVHEEVNRPCRQAFTAEEVDHLLRRDVPLELVSEIAESGASVEELATAGRIGAERDGRVVRVGLPALRASIFAMRGKQMH